MKKISIILFIVGFYVNAFSQENFTGSLKFVSSSIEDQENDTTTYFFSALRLLTVNNTEDNIKRQTTRRIIDMPTQKCYYINDKEKIVLEAEITNEYPTRNFKRFDSTKQVLGFKAHYYFSDMNVQNPTSNTENVYKIGIWVSDSLTIENIPDSLYLVNFKVYMGRIILGYEGRYYFDYGFMQDSSHAVSKLISLKREKLPDSLFQIGKGYTIEKYTKERYDELFIKLDYEEVLEMIKKNGY
ncbi:MAG: hypothetical protein ACKVOW_15205 [Chitinophagaceae bacterium]